jgi:hypothetical protein
MLALQFDWTAALMVLGLLVAMVCVFYTRAQADVKLRPRRSAAAKADHRGIAVAAWDARPWAICSADALGERNIR